MHKRHGGNYHLCELCWIPDEVTERMRSICEIELLRYEVVPPVKLVQFQIHLSQASTDH